MLNRADSTTSLFNLTQNTHRDTSPDSPSQWELRARQEALLDAAVQETFPASDPVAVMRVF